MARLVADAVRVYVEALEAILCGDCIGNRSPSVISTFHTTTASSVGDVVYVPVSIPAAPIAPDVSPPVVFLQSLHSSVPLVCDYAPVERLVVPAIVGVSLSVPEFTGWNVRACQSVTFDEPGEVGGLDRSYMNRIHSVAASGTLVGIRLRTAYLEKVVGAFEVRSLLKFQPSFVPNEREARFVRLMNSYLIGYGVKPPILSPSFWWADYAPLCRSSCTADAEQFRLARDWHFT